MESNWVWEGNQFCKKYGCLSTQGHKAFQVKKHWKATLLQVRTATCFYLGSISAKKLAKLGRGSHTASARLSLLFDQHEVLSPSPHTNLWCGWRKKGSPWRMASTCNTWPGWVLPSHTFKDLWKQAALIRRHPWQLFRQFAGCWCFDCTAAILSVLLLWKRAYMHLLKAAFHGNYINCYFLLFIVFCMILQRSTQIVSPV